MRSGDDGPDDATEGCVDDMRWRSHVFDRDWAAMGERFELRLEKRRDDFGIC